ncbi:TBC1 domain family member 2A isoform X2 [Bufo bufo]|uniref:TBC1 domain family member 2A isoform X2 n=1 Tax=Bufo bufo TaxID=8384 RepID=UPI001ABE160A|nr:TBC1 domain family member 2A isoform X2 [Bufo bufo]
MCSVLACPGDSHSRKSADTSALGAALTPKEMSELDGNDKEPDILQETPSESGAPEKPLNAETDVQAEDHVTVATTDVPCLTPSKVGEEGTPNKLCGYLYKLGMKGPLKAWKYRFFCYNDKKCHLLYYRMATDVCPLGSIDLHTATFHFSMEAEEGIFEIKTLAKTYILKAINKHAKMYWLQQLQRKRWEYCNNTSKMTMSSDVLDSDDNLHSADGDFFPHVKTPTEVVGLTVASMPVPQESTSLQNISLKHPWKEIQNTVRNICGSKPFQLSRSVFHFEESEQAAEVEVTAKQFEKMSPSLNFARKARKQNGCLPSNHDNISHEKMNNSQLQIQAVTEELKSQKDLVKLLHRALESAQEEKRACSEYLSAPEEKDRLELIRHKVRQIEDLRQRVEALEQKKLDQEQCLSFKDIHIGELKEHVQLLMEKNNAKQQVIMKQNEQLLSQIDSDHKNRTDIETLQGQFRKIDSLMDDINAYKTQNQFLNSEIHQVTQLWRNTAKKETAQLMKCSYLEARNCQIESKYLILLRKLQEVLPNMDAEYCAVIKRLIEDALESDIKVPLQPSTVHFNPVSEYDDYGFMIIPEHEVEHLKLLAKIQALEIRSNKLLTHEVVDKPLQMKWNSIEELSHSTELKTLVRCGIPTEHRKRVWKWLTSRRIRICANHYKDLLRKCESAQHPASQQIELDLHRTLTNNKHFNSPTSEVIQKLRRVLLAYSWQNPTIGYCQGLNRLAAMALLVLEDEESAFYCLVDIVENIMPADYYSNNLSGSQVDQRVFKDFLSEKLPRLTAHFEQYRVDLSLVTFNWFLVIFVDSLVSDILLRVWDAFLYEGTKVIFRYALAIFKYNEEEILKLTDETEIYQYLSFFTKTICDGRKLMNIAFYEMNPFPMKLVRNRRAAHMEKFKAALVELENIKLEYVKSKRELRSTDNDMGVSEDEEDT